MLKQLSESARVVIMAAKLVIKGVHVVAMGFANAFLIEGDDGLTLIDSGYPAKEVSLFRAIRALGVKPRDSVTTQITIGKK
jgi:Metallo-beta-lactamase superfamily